MYVSNQFRYTIIVSSVARMEIGCGEEKGCFGYPSGCVKTQKCAMLSTYQYIHLLVDNVNLSSGYNSTIDQKPRGKFDMQLQLDTSLLNFSGTTHPLPFVAMAFSFDRLMGEDFVLACHIISNYSGLVKHFNPLKESAVKI